MSAKNIIPALLNYSLSVAARVVSLGMVLVLLIVAFSLAAPYVKVGKDQRYVKSIMAAEQAITRPVRAAVPIRIQGHDMTGWIVLVGSLVLAAWFNLDALHLLAEQLHHPLVLQGGATGEELLDQENIARQKRLLHRVIRAMLIS